MGTSKMNVVWAPAVAIWVSVTGCGGAEGDGDMVVLGPAERPATAAVDGVIDPDDPCASLTAPGEPPARIVWLTDPDGVVELEIPGTVGIDWAFRYAVRTPSGEQAAYTIEHERCGVGEPTCDAFLLPMPAEACAVLYAPRFGIDPEQYHPGLNEYHFSLRLFRGAVLESSSEMLLKVMVQAAPPLPS